MRILIFVVMLVSMLLAFVPAVLAGEIGAVTTVDRVIDGDTFDTISEGRVRLADVDAPESGEPGYNEAKSFLIDLVYDKVVVLDIDDVYETDPYGRLVCVVYVRHNSSHYLNVNKALLVEGVAVIKNYHNEFNPYSWTLYAHEDSIPEIPSLIIIPLLMTTTLLAVLLSKRCLTKTRKHALQRHTEAIFC